MASVGLITVDTRNIPEPYIMFEHLFGVGPSKIDFKAACIYLDTPESTIRRWYVSGQYLK